MTIDLGIMQCLEIKYIYYIPSQINAINVQDNYHACTLIVFERIIIILFIY